MNILEQFIAYILQFVDRALYVWGGQGQLITSTAQIRKMETSSYNAKRVIAFWRKRGNVPGFDCSGLGVQGLILLGLITGDMTANDMMHKCTMIARSDIKLGDWVFRVYKETVADTPEKKGHTKGDAYHIGYVVKIIGGVIYVVESMGRDDGVVMRRIDEHEGAYWNAYGRPSYFKQLIETPVVDKTGCPYPEPTRAYDSNDIIRGNDARWFEWQLFRIGNTPAELGCTRGIDEHGTDGTAAVKVWTCIHFQQRCAGLPVGDADDRIREYLKSVPTR